LNGVIGIYIYFFILGVSFCSFLVFTKEFKAYALHLVTLVMMLAMALLVLRDPLAPYDSINYMSMYNGISDFTSIFDAYHKNYTFSFFQYLGRKFWISPETYLIVQSLIFFGILVYGLSKISISHREYLVSVAFFVLTSTFLLLFTNVVRQGLALSLFVLSIGYYVSNRKLFSYGLLFLTAFAHSSGMLLVPLFVAAAKIKLSKKSVVVIILLLPLLPVFSHLFINNLASLGGIAKKIQSLGEREYSNSLVYAKVFLLYMFSWVLYLGGSWNARSTERLKFISSIYLMLLAVVLFFLPVLLVSSRFVYYASGLIPVLISILVFHSEIKINYRVKGLCVLVISVVYGFFVFSFSSTSAQLGV
jgi:hypothetical protein